MATSPASSRTDGRRIRAVGSSQMLTVAETAAVLGLAEKTIRNWLYLRRLPSVRVGRAVRVPFVVVAQLLDEGAVPALPERALAR